MRKINAIIASRINRAIRSLRVDVKDSDDKGIYIETNGPATQIIPFNIKHYFDIESLDDDTSNKYIDCICMDIIRFLYKEKCLDVNI